MKSPLPPAKAPTTASTACVVPTPVRGGGGGVEYFWRVTAVLWRAVHGQRTGREAGKQVRTSVSDIALAAHNGPPSPAARPEAINDVSNAATLLNLWLLPLTLHLLPKLCEP